MSPGLTSIIIINYKTPELTIRLIDSIETHSREDGFEIILIDNGSGDSSSTKFKIRYPTIALIENKSNLGFAKAANQGAAAATGEYLWFVNSDCFLTQPIIGELKKILADNPMAGLVTPKTLDKQGRFFSVCRKFPTYRNIVFSRGSLLSRLPFMSRYAENYTLPDYAELTEVPAISGTAMFTRREDFHQSGGFDEGYFMYMEDTDLCLRFEQAGKGRYYAPQVSLIHEHRGSSVHNRIVNLFRHHLSILEYFLKWHRENWFENLGLFFLLTINLLFQIILSYAGLLRNNRS